MAKLRSHAEKVKKELTFANESGFSIDSLKEDEDLEIVVTKEKFE